jgi:hypothetical protein
LPPLLDPLARKLVESPGQFFSDERHKSLELAWVFMQR